MSKVRLVALGLTVGAVTFMAGSGSLLGQADLQIARPLDGATVRETVNITVPASYVPKGGFVAYYIDGRFRCAVCESADRSGVYIYSWDTKALDPDRSIPEENRKPRDGQHKIAVQVYDSVGRKVAGPKEINVYVKNNAASDMPQGGLQLLYAHKAGTENRYKMKSTIDLKSIGGATNLATSAREAIEGIEVVVKRSVEDALPGDKALIRQKLVGTIKYIRNQLPSPVAGVTAKATYEIEDRSGRAVDTITTSYPGVAVSIDMPITPVGRVRIGDTWAHAQRIFSNVMTGEAATVDASSVLEGLEWEGGYTCAKIRTTFSGTSRIPFSAILTEPVPISGETVTYFAYRVGKVISSTATATVETSVDQSVASSLSQYLAGPQGGGVSLGPGAFTPSDFGGLGGPAGMEGPLPGLIGPGGLGRSGLPSGGAAEAEQKVIVKFQINQVLRLVH